MTQKTLHFSFSPVQPFVSQARRTRDLWVGSFLLSWLSGHAMLALGKENIEMPDVSKDPLIAAIEAQSNGERIVNGPEIGSLPNRFVARLPKEKSGGDCAAALKREWIRIADEVLKHINRDTKRIESSEGSIWHRQVNNLWECVWVLGEEGYRLEQRKNLRTHLTPSEPGEKCSVCGERQELSGITEPTNLRTKIKKWWDDNIRGKVHDLDLREKERLCAVCLIKRALPIVSNNLFGWKIPRFYPSTAYLSAIDWLIEMLKRSRESGEVRGAANEFVEAASNKKILDPKYQKAEWSTKTKSIEEALSQSTIDKRIADLDGDVFFVESLRGDELEMVEEAKQVLIGKLGTLHDALRLAGMKYSKPSPFYAMLLMDGDGMGKLLSGRTIEQRRRISKALLNFSTLAPGIVSKYDGKLIYAGADDVFALLSVNNAIACANQCRWAYEKSFEEEAPFVKPSLATISAAINFAHMKTALGVVVRDSHRLLDEVAKDKTGRNAIACRVWKRGGPILSWSQPWQIAEYGDLIKTILDAFQNDAKLPDQYSSKFFYKLRDVFDLAKPEEDHPRLSVEQIEKLLVADYLAIREHVWEKNILPEKKLQIALERVRPILRLCRETRRELKTEQHNGESCEVEAFCSGGFTIDGAMLVRFLAQKEV